MKKDYSVWLDDNEIGTTKLEKADALMGVVFGEIDFISSDLGYDFFKKYCTEHQIQIATDYPEDRGLTANIPGLKVISFDGVEIKGSATVIEGMKQEFEVTILGVAYPFFGKKFPHHVKADRDRFKKV